jgi:hypothetical protein
LAYVKLGISVFGPVDLVRGEACIATRFFHIYDFPLVPLGSYVIPVDNISRLTGFRGAPVALNPKSIFLAYLRGLCGALAIVACFALIFAGIGLYREFGIDGRPLLAHFAGLAIGLIALIAVLNHAMGRLHGVSLATPARAEELRALLRAASLGS